MSCKCKWTFVLAIGIVLLKYNCSLEMAIHKFEEDKNCQRLSQWTKKQRREQAEHHGEIVVSGIDCVRRCAQQSDLNKKCLYTMVTQQNLDDGNKLVCELFSLDGDEMLLQINLHTFSNTFSNKSNFKYIQSMYPPICYAYTNETSTFSPALSSHVDEDSIIPPNNWQVFISTGKDYLWTQDKDYIRNNKVDGVHYKFLFLDHMGVYTIVSSSYSSFYNGQFFTQALDLMEKSRDGFVKDSARRLMYTGVFNGKLYTVAIDPDGSYNETLTKPQQLQIFREIDIFYNISTETEGIDETQFRTYLEQGFNVFGHKTAIVWNDEKVSLSDINTSMNTQSVNKIGKVLLPPEYFQRTTVYNIFRQKARQPISVSEGTIRITNHFPSSFHLNPFWKQVSDSMTTADAMERLMAMQGKITKGHLFRVRFDNTYHVVEDLLIFNDEIYFILPQQLTVNSEHKFDVNSFGIRGVVTFSGDYIRCDHFFEGNSFGNQPVIEQVNGGVHVFADTNKWVSVFSIYYDGINGRHIFGNVADLANNVLEGRNVNILLLYEDTTRFMRIQLLTVHDFNSPNILVSGESYVSWNLIPDGSNQFLTINDACDMEKVLVRSNGEVHVLVYNNPTRNPIKVLQNVQTTWYVN